MVMMQETTPSFVVESFLEEVREQRHYLILGLKVVELRLQEKELTTPPLTEGARKDPKSEHGTPEQQVDQRA